MHTTMRTGANSFEAWRQHNKDIEERINQEWLRVVTISRTNYLISKNDGQMIPGYWYDTIREKNYETRK